jgi:NTP pyrophosphatase (non-canonical NTP hydrolase)
MSALGLAGETGEAVEVVKKYMRIILEEGQIHHQGFATVKKEITGELGDVLFYLTELGAQFGLSLEDIQRYNTTKLNKRSGNDRQRELWTEDTIQPRAALRKVPK